MEHDTNAERIAALDEPHTPGPWVGVSAEIISTDGGPSVERTMVAGLPPGMTPKQATPADLIEVAMFVRPADARRVIACVEACKTFPTDVLESMPPTAMLQAAVEKLTTVYHAAQDDSAWEAMRKEILSFHTVTTRH